MSTSKLQQETWNRLHVLLGGFNVIENARPDWLRNPETGYTLELDFYLPEAGIAIEVQGEQHVKHIPYFHPTVEAFEAQLRRDRVKRETCQEKGIRLYEIFKPADIEQFIKDAGTYNGEIAHKLHKKYTALESIRWMSTRACKQLRMGDRDGAGALMRRVMKICQKYGVDPESIDPIEEPSKARQAFYRSLIVKLFRGSKERRREIDAAIIEWSTTAVRCKWMEYGDRGAYMDGWFSLPDGKPLDQPGAGWKLATMTLPAMIKGAAK